MSNLIPTPRTDKNGVTRIRHMRAEAASSARLFPALPPVQPEAHAGLTNEEFSVLLDPQSLVPKELSKCLDMLRESNPKTLPLISELLTTGNENGRKLARRKFTTVLNEIANAYTANPARGMPWKFSSPRIESEIAKNWAIGNVAKELGIEMRSDRDYHNLHGPASNIHFLQQSGTTNRASMTTAYWRGVIAFTQTTVVWVESNKSSVNTFISWSGKRADLQTVIDLASERDTLDVETLSGVLNERDSSSPVRDGVL